MPTAAQHPCANAPRCRRLTSRRLCSQCDAANPRAGSSRWDTDRRITVRMRGRRLQAARAALFAREPLCRECVRAGRTRLATIRDHVVPLAEGGVDDETNEQPLCQDCSDLKTHEESKRGRMREASAR
jgi:5-methylcytosine-specific restriction protein A